MTVQDDIQRAIQEEEERRMKRRASILQWGMPAIAVFLALAGMLIAAGGIQGQTERAKQDLQVQQAVNVELRKSDAEQREMIAEQRFMIIELSVNLQAFMEANGLKYKRGVNGIR